NVSSATAYVINRMLKQNPEERYQSYEDLIEHLNYAKTKLMSGEAGTQRRATVVMKDKSQEKIITFLTLGVLILLLVGGATVFFMRDSLFGKEKKGYDRDFE